MILENLNLPIAVVHNMKGKQYKIPGMIQSINEEAETCRVKFKNGRTEEIPVEYIYLTEGILDKIKNVAKKAASWIVKKVKGFIVFIGKNGEENVDNMPNRLIMQSKGENPKQVTLYPSRQLVNECREFGANIKVPNDDDMCNKEIDREVNEINRFWERVMERTATTPETIGESIDYVRETFYYNTLNEAGAVDLKNTPDAFGRAEQYGAEVSRDELIQLIKQNVSNQLRMYESALADAIIEYTPSDDDIKAESEIKVMEDDSNAESPWANLTWEEEDENGNIVTVGDNFFDIQQENNKLDLKAAKGEFVKPLMIWGAPGIGKTQIVKQALLDMKNDTNGSYNFNVYTFACQNINEDSVVIPSPGNTIKIKKNDGTDAEVERAYFKLASMQFLPIYTPGSEKDNEVQEKHLNHSMHLTSDGTAMVDKNGDTYNCGVIFLDELVRAKPSGMTALMGLCRREYQTMKLASNWAIVAASNRDIDSPEQEGFNMIYDQAFSDTFVHVTFVPKKTDWVEWAESHNKSGFMSKIDSKILDFIRKAPDKYWYRTIANGGFNEDLRKAAEVGSEDVLPVSGSELETYLNEIDQDPEGHINPEFYNKVLADILSTQNGGFLSKTVVGWTPRTIQQMSDAYRNALRDLFHYDYVDKDGKIVEGSLSKDGVTKGDYSTLYDYPNLVLRSIIGDMPTVEPGKTPTKEQIQKALELKKKAMNMINGKDYKYKSTAIDDAIFAKAVSKLKKGELIKWMNKYFDKNDVSTIMKALSRGSMTYTDLQNRLLLKTARTFTNNAKGVSADKVNADDNIFVQELGKDLEWRNYMNQETINSIYDMGRLPKNLLGKDCLNKLAWKTNAELYKECVKYVLDSFPAYGSQGPADQMGEYFSETISICERIQYYLGQLGSSLSGAEALKEAMRLTVESSGKTLPAANPADTDDMKPFVSTIERKIDTKSLTELFTFNLYGITNNKLGIIWKYPIVDIAKMSSDNSWYLFILNHITKNIPFYDRILNFVKWIASSDITGGSKTAMTQIWANTRTAFIEYLKENMQGVATHIDDETELFNIIAELKKNLRVNKKDTTSYIDSLDVFNVIFNLCTQAFMSYNVEAKEIQKKYGVNYQVGGGREEMGEKEKAMRAKAGMA